MAKLHHATLKAAVLKYGALHAEGKTEAEIKADIAKDEKSFDADGINEIYAAITVEGEDKNAGADKNKDNDSDSKEKEIIAGKDKAPEVPQTPKTKKASKHIVVCPFRDKDNFNVLHVIGTDVSHFDANRLEDLLNKKLVEKQ